MLDSDKEILEQFARQVVPELQAVSGSFGPSIGYHFGGKALVIDAHPHIGVLMYGRGPTKQGASKGDPSLQESILAWINRHNIQPRDNGTKPITKEALSFMIAKSIHENGTRLYQEIKRGAKPKDPFGNIITEERIEAVLNLLSTSYEQRITSELLNIFKQ